MASNFIGVLIGIYLSAVGYRLIPLVKDRIKNEQFLEQYGAHLRVLGPLIMFANVLLVLSELISGSAT